MRILYQGLLRSPASWARVGRGLIGGFLELGVDIAAVASRGFLHDPEFPLPDGLRCLTPGEAHRGTPPEIGLGFLHPPLLHRLIGERKVALFVWESDRIPDPWVEPLTNLTDLVAVPSHFTADALSASGVPAEQVAVAPYGFDRDLLACRPGRTADAFTFLCVAAPHWRKGVRELVAAYDAEFDADEDVLLRIKTTYDPRQGRSFEIESWEALLGERRDTAPAIEIEVAGTPDATMAATYEGAHVLVSPTWGESFGLAILEAMAAGLPVITTGWGGQLEFLPEDADRLPFELRPADGVLYEEVPAARVAVPDVAALARCLRRHFENHEESATRGARARRHVESMTWRAAARRLAELLGLDENLE